MKNENSRRPSVERKNFGANRGAGSQSRNSNSSSRRSSSKGVWSIARESGEQFDSNSSQSESKTFYSDFVQSKNGGERSGDRSTMRQKVNEPRRRNDSDKRQSDEKSHKSSDGKRSYRHNESGGNSEAKPYKRDDRKEPQRKQGGSQKIIVRKSRSSNDSRDKKLLNHGEENESRQKETRKVFDSKEDDKYGRPFERKRPYHEQHEAKRENTGKPKRKRVAKSADDGLIRLNKFIANSGVCSRREADEFIAAGVVTVNGTFVNELGARVSPTDDIRFNGERLKGEKKVYVLLNKPKNYVTTVEDPHADRTVMDLVKQICTERIYPVGRLDRNSTGVLLFTNDGELTKQLTHPSYNKMKVYHVFLDKPVTQRDMRALVEGVSLEDGIGQADAVNYVGDKKTEIGLEIHSGRNRIVRRLFASLGYEVLKLDRVLFAGLTKKNLRRGECRLLTQKEIDMLRMGAYE